MQHKKDNAAKNAALQTYIVEDLILLNYSKLH